MTNETGYEPITTITLDGGEGQGIDTLVIDRQVFVVDDTDSMSWDLVPGGGQSIDGIDTLIIDGQTFDLSTISLTKPVYSCMTCGDNIDSDFPSLHSCAPALVRRIESLEDRIYTLECELNRLKGDHK